MEKQDTDLDTDADTNTDLDPDLSQTRMRMHQAALSCGLARAMNNPLPGDEHILALMRSTLIGLSLMFL